MKWKPREVENKVKKESALKVENGEEEKKKIQPWKKKTQIFLLENLLDFSHKTRKVKGRIFEGIE